MQEVGSITLRPKSNTIYKWPLQLGENILQLPWDAKILHVDWQDGPQGHSGFKLWALVDKNQHMRDTVRISIYGTGGDMPDNPGEHLGTILVGAYVWHVFRE